MACRKRAPSVGTEENSDNKQRRKLLNETDQEHPSTVSAASESPASFDDLVVDCLVHILSFLPTDDMNSLAICTPRCREARNNESLDQTRTGTIVLSTKARESVTSSLERALVVADTVLSAKYTKLKIMVVPSRHSRCAPSHRLPPPSRPAILRHVKRLDLSLPLRMNEIGSDDIADDLGRFFHDLRGRCLRNVQELCVCGFSYNSVLSFCSYRPSVSRLSLKGCTISAIYLPFYLPLRHVSELILDNCRFVFGKKHFGTWLLQHCAHLERLVMVNNTRLAFQSYDRSVQDVPSSERSVQDILMTLIRRHRSLRWFRCDMLAVESVATLQRERPEITFVTE